MNKSHPRPLFFAAIIILGGALSSTLSGCTGMAIGAGATAATAASQERGFGTAVNDTMVRAEINDLWFRHDIGMYTDIGLSVVEGRVLLTGKVEKPENRIDAVRLAWKADGVREVINEIVVTDQGGIGSYARDTWISTQLKTKLLFDADVQSINYSIDTVAGVVYLIGIAQNNAELTKVTNHARSLSYVKRVVSYVIMKGDPSRKKS